MMKLYGLVRFFIFLLPFCIFFVTTHSPMPPEPQPMPPPPPPPGPNPSPTPKPPKNVTVPAVFVFGDSLVDTGNNNNRSTPLRCNFRPYGINFGDSVPTGRYCDGKVPSDFLAEYLGIKPVVPAYLDPSLKSDDLLTGVCFASGGSGYIPLTSKYLNVIPMLDQLTYFQEYMARVKKLVGQEKADELIANGLAIVFAGANDVSITYYGPGAQWVKEDIYSFTTKLVDSAASFALQLYGYGARHIEVVGISPLGCQPAERILKGGPHRGCDKEFNYAAQIYNGKLAIALGQLSKTLPDSKLVFIDIYSPFSHILQNHLDYGFKVIKEGCCGTGLVEAGPLCNQVTSSVCNNISAYLFWDSLHPTQRFYQIITKMLVDKYIPLLF